MKYPPLLLKYLKMFQEDPHSKIFAPLAESYRKLGLVDQAIEICLEGLQHNPEFIGGKVALARAYADKQWHAKVRETLAPMIEKIPDNLIAQRLFADASLALGYVQEALTAYKMLLYFNPLDQEIAATVQELETAAYERGGLIRANTVQIKELKTLSPPNLSRLLKLQKMLNKIRESRGEIIPEGLS